MASPTTVIFDLGGVLIDWNPRHLYRKLISDPAEMERFLAEVCTREWHERQDRGGDNDEATATLIARHLAHETLIRAWYGRFAEMMLPMPETETILRALDSAGVPLFAITNWPAEPFPPPADRFGFIDVFRDVVVSGRVGCMKPDPAIFHLALERFAVDAGETVFIDDNPANAAAARDLGLHGLHFRDAATLREELADLGLPA
ncbi:MAG: HAD family phosphatase [Alphaproteobacteria bacterium]